MYPPSTAVAQQPRINAAITEVVREFAPHVVQIRYDIDQDWSGDWAVFFRVLLSDEASKVENLHDIASRVRSRMAERVDFSAAGLLSYFYFRSQSEQAAMREPSWA